MTIENIDFENKIQIFDVVGNLIEEFNKGRYSIQVDISNYICGIYFIKAGNQKPVKLVKT